MQALILLLAFQFGQTPSDHRRHEEELSRMEELGDESKFRLAEKRAEDHRKSILSYNLKCFVEAWNLYAKKESEGLNALRERKAAIKAWNTLMKTEGFEITK